MWFCCEMQWCVGYFRNIEYERKIKFPLTSPDVMKYSKNECDLKYFCTVTQVALPSFVKFNCSRLLYVYLFYMLLS